MWQSLKTQHEGPGGAQQAGAPGAQAGWAVGEAVDAVLQNRNVEKRDPLNNIDLTVMVTLRTGILEGGSQQPSFCLKLLQGQP